MFSIGPKTNFNFSVIFILSSASALNLDQFKNLSFGKELKNLKLVKGSANHLVKKNIRALDGKNNMIEEKEKPRVLRN